MADKEKKPGLPSRGLKLDTLAGVRGEMARLYRMAATGKIEPHMMNAFIYALKEIRCCIEGETLDSLHRRLAEVAAKVK